MSSQELWTLRRDAPRMSAWDADLTGFQVVGVDGVVGVVVSTSGESGRSHVVVDIGQWIYGRRVVIPARFVRDVDHSSEALYVRLSREQVRAAPPYDAVAGHDGHRARAEAYFGPIAARPGPQAGALVRGPSAGRRTTASSTSRPAADRTAGTPRRQSRR